MSSVAIRRNSIRIPQEDMWCAPLSGLPQGEAHGTRDHHTQDDSISYLNMLSRSLTKSEQVLLRHLDSLPQTMFRRHPVWTPCLDIFTMDFKELSLISDCFGDQKAIKTPKLNTI